MPEGDTIHRVAARLRGALGEGPIVTFDAPGARGTPPEPGERIEEITARGKHLLISFGGGSILHTHLRMSGSWRLGAPEDAPALGAGRPGRAASVVTGSASAWCLHASMVELLDAAGVRRHRQLAALGPDLCNAEINLEEVIRRLGASDPATPIGVALLDQRLASGIGNVYRSEVLWACGVDPFAAIADVDEATRRDLYMTAHTLLRRNLALPRRRTIPGGLAVYERGGRACPRCRGRIEARRLGEQARTVWWCSSCQTAPGGRPADAASPDARANLAPLPPAR